MRKRIEPAPMPQLQIQQFSFARPRRSWLPATVLAAPPARVLSTPAAGSWIHRARLN